MNVNDIKNGLTQSFGRTGLKLQKHSPEILLTLGLIGGIAAAVMAVRASKKVDGVVEATKESLEAISTQDDMSEEEKLKAKALVVVSAGVEYGKTYGPAVGVGVLSITAILASHGVMANRNASLMSAYALLAEGYKNYRNRVVDELGADVDRDFYLGVKDEKRTETVKDEDGKNVKVKTVHKGTINGKSPSIYSRFFDESNPMFRRDSRMLNKAFLVAQQNYLNDELILRGHLFLNRVYESLGFPHTSEGAIVGWVLRSPEEMKAEGRDGYVDFGMFDVDNDPAREFINGTNPTILLDFNVDGVIWDKI